MVLSAAAASSIASRGRDARARTGSSPRAGCTSGGCFGSAIVAWIAYGFLFGYVHGWIFEDAYGVLTQRCHRRADAPLSSALGRLRDLRRAPARSAIIVFDYARIRIVVEDRRSAIGGLLRRGAVRGPPRRRQYLGYTR